MKANSQKEIQALVQLVQKTQHGFTDIQKAADKYTTQKYKLAGKFLEG